MKKASTVWVTVLGKKVTVTVLTDLKAKTSLLATKRGWLAGGRNLKQPPAVNQEVAGGMPGGALGLRTHKRKPSAVFYVPDKPAGDERVCS